MIGQVEPSFERRPEPDEPGQCVVPPGGQEGDRAAQEHSQRCFTVFRDRLLPYRTKIVVDYPIPADYGAGRERGSPSLRTRTESR